MVSDADNFVVCDFRRGYAFGCVDNHVANDASFLRYHFLDTAALTLALQLFLAPLHGALVVRHHCGIALGPGRPANRPRTGRDDRRGRGGRL